MSSFEEETYSTVFTSLRHPIRRKILRTLSAGPQSFSDLQKSVGIESPHLTYHLEGLTSLLTKTEHGEYALSSLGRTAVSTMKQVEEPPSTLVHSRFWPRFWRRGRMRVLALGIICVLLAGGLVGVFAYHVSAMNDKNGTISSLNSQVTTLQNQIVLANSTIDSLNSQTALLESQLASDNSIVLSENGTIANLQSQVATLRKQFNDLATDYSAQVLAFSGTVYILADGSVDPPIAPISTVDNVTYTLTGDIYGSIVVKRDNIMVDGAGHTVQGPGLTVKAKGIDLSGTSGVTVKDFNVEKFWRGISVTSASHDVITGNNITDGILGIWLVDALHNVVSGNNVVSNDGTGVDLESSLDNNVSGNNITANDFVGITLESSSNNSILGNTFLNDGLMVMDSYGNVVADNVVNGKPLVYLEDVSDYSVGDAGQVVLVRCNRVEVENLTISDIGIGIELWQTNNTSIIGNIIANNWFGIVFQGSSHDTVSRNNITSNSLSGLEFDSSSGSTIYLNNFDNNLQVSSGINSTNFFDNGTRGNYWSDYTGPDANYDGIGDTLYATEAGVDRYPLMKPFDPIQVFALGDLNKDGKVGLGDLVILAKAYGSKPGDPNWNPTADIDGNGIVDLSDLVILASHYGYQQI
ncbi:MAG: NosD domain-containing protein [Candidatus Bathyarchaeia archaeon]|jgi:parallel beta-helix repeat protein